MRYPKLEKCLRFRLVERGAHLIVEVKISMDVAKKMKLKKGMKMDILFDGEHCHLIHSDECEHAHNLLFSEGRKGRGFYMNFRYTDGQLTSDTSAERCALESYSHNNEEAVFQLTTNMISD